MSNIEIVLPRMGEGIIEATIIRWLKSEGEPVNIDDPILEIATDKVDSEITSTGDGFLVKQFFKEGDVVAIGATVALVSSEKELEHPAENAPSNSKSEIATCSTTSIDFESIEIKLTQDETSESPQFFSPLVKNMARIENISMSELEKIKGSGSDGRITKNDLETYIKNKSANSVDPSPQIITPKIEPAFEAQAQNAPINAVANNGDNILEMDRMRKLIADHMVMSVKTSAHVTSIIEVNMSKVVNWRNKTKDAFQKREGEKITFTPIFFDVVAKALKEFPGVNASVDGNKIIYRKNVNIGMATVLPNGNLIVPVIKDADQKNLLGMTKTINDLATRARSSKLQPDEIQGGTFSITNLGSFDTLIGTPIINQPQVAILSVGAIRKQPIVVESPYGDSIGIAPMMYLSLSYDHRVVDGGMGGLFIKRVKELLETFDENTVI